MHLSKAVRDEGGVGGGGGGGGGGGSGGDGDTAAARTISYGERSYRFWPTAPLRRRDIPDSVNRLNYA